CGTAFFDYDNNGWLDILALSGSRFGDPPPTASNACTRTTRDGTFTDVTKTAGLLSAKPRFGTGCAFLDYDRDGKLDLFVSNYLLFEINSVPRAGADATCNHEGVFCGPRGLPYGRHSLYRNNGDGTFTDVSEAAGIAKAAGGYGLTVTAADFDNDGWPDIYVACDSTPSLFFHNNHDGTFTEQGLERGVALSDDGMEQAGMGLGVGDFRQDGNLHIVKTHFAADTPVVYVNDGKGNFRDETLRSGLAVETRFISWGIGVADLDNNGTPDLFWVTGGIYPELQNAKPRNPIKLRASCSATWEGDASRNCCTRSAPESRPATVAAAARSATSTTTATSISSL
ncbi:MAG: FG-GAP repeat domain-containing protein, partial [Bryobacteraceae bacterium]